MKAKIGNKIVEAWQISKESPTESWVLEAFSSNKIWWTSHKKGVEMPLLMSLFVKKSKRFNENLKTLSKYDRNSFGESYLELPAFPSSQLGKMGDYLVHDHQVQSGYTIISEKNFQENYKLIEN